MGFLPTPPPARLNVSLNMNGYLSYGRTDGWRSEELGPSLCKAKRQFMLSVGQVSILVCRSFLPIVPLPKPQ